MSTVLLETPAEGVALVTLNRPDQGNGVVPELVDEFMAALARFERDLAVRAVVLTGAGKNFCAGADLQGMRSYLRDRLPAEHEPYNSRALLPLTQALYNSRLPIVAAINGAAVAGGLDLALACDIRIASRKARLGETYINVGLAPGNGGTWFLPKLVGSGMAAELALTGEIVDAERAVAIGLVNRVVEHEALLPDSIALAARIATKPWRAVEATKQALHASWNVDLASAMAGSHWVTAALQYTDDVREGIEAAIEKRAPEYNRKKPPSG